MKKALGVLAVSLLVGSCGSQDSKSQHVDIQVVPDRPIVFTGDYTTPNGTKIKEPWFRFQVLVTNNSEDAITVISINLHVSIVNDNGNMIEVDGAMSPSDGNYTMSCQNTTTAQITFSDFGTIPSGRSKYLGLKYQLTSQLPSDCTTAPVGGTVPNPDIYPVLFYLGGNPSKTKDNISNYAYSVTLTPVGYFGTAAAPSDRFEKTVFFTTQ